MRNIILRSKQMLLLVTCLIAAGGVQADTGDDPLLGMVLLNQFEWRNGDDDRLAWDGDAWLGKDLNKLWLKTEGEYADNRAEEIELQLLYSRAVATYWDFQVGWRGDFRPDPGRNWLAVGFNGLAPYFFEIDAAVFLGGSGRTAARLEFDYDILFTQRLILQPEIEINAFGKDDPVVGIGSGLSDIQAGLRLRYEIRREFAPYIGINWWSKLGDTRDIAAEGEQATDDLEILAGVRIWF
jgi:copper resistance protein B